MKSSVRWVLLTLGLLAAVAVALVWRAPFGTGEYLTSPDMKVVAHVSHLSRGTFFGREHYLQLELRSEANDEVLVSKTLPVNAADVVPAYENRALRHLEWASDSSRVAVEITNGKTMDLGVPGR